MIIFGVGVHCCEVLNTSKYQNSGHIFAITTWGFGITISLFIFGAVNINPAMVVAQAVLGNIPWASVIPISIAEVLGGVFGSIVVFIAYYDQFKASIDIDRVKIRNIFSTNPNVRNLPRNFFVEFIDTFYFYHINSCDCRSNNRSSGDTSHRCRPARMGHWYGYGRSYRICDELGSRHGTSYCPCYSTNSRRKSR
ncbi:glycerol uptake facilitator protein [Sporolactobacillus inulinus]|uniref:Glycerol uptake facilitator protein n=1 Tax=Sporolactobacillus inulinus TaxID=2078 RepID=A0A4Y1ZDU9_9BACL|nr:glycerol uptake facilitator protein [Sporolactobacillus inulinus]